MSLYPDGKPIEIDINLLTLIFSYSVLDVQTESPRKLNIETILT